MALRLRLGAFAPLFFLVAVSSGDAFGYRIPKAGTDYRLLSSCPNAPNARFVCVRIGSRGADANGLAEVFGITAADIRRENPAYTLALCSDGGGRLTRGWGRIMPDQAKNPQYVTQMRRSNAAWEDCPADRRIVALIPGSVLALPRPSPQGASAECPSPPAISPCSPQTVKTVTVAKDRFSWPWYFAIGFGSACLAILAYSWFRRREFEGEASHRKQSDTVPAPTFEEEEEGEAETLATRLHAIAAERDALQEELDGVKEALVELHRVVTCAPLSEQAGSRIRIRIIREVIAQMVERVTEDAETAFRLLHAKGYPPKPINGALVEQMRSRVRAVRRSVESLKSRDGQPDQPERELPPDSEQAE